jgi:hypothetical protein
MPRSVARVGATSLSSTVRSNRPRRIPGPITISGMWVSYEYAAPCVVPVEADIQ